MTANELAERSRRAVAAAAAVGRELGLTVREPRVLHDVFSVVVHLAPAPVVARVPVVLPPSLHLEAQRSRQARELAAVAWLAAQGHPVVRPSPLVPLEPLLREGFSITLWEFVEVARDVQPDYIASAPLAADLHAALRGYPGELPFLSPVASTVPSCLAVLEANPGLLAASDLDRARREWDVLGPLLSSAPAFEAAFPRVTLQPIHGDAPSYNLIHTMAGVRYADFEDVTLGPIEWDLVGLGDAAANAYDIAAAGRRQRPLDRSVLRVMEVGRMLQVVACFALVPQLPMLATGLAPMLDQWRAMPFAAGITGS